MNGKWCYIVYGFIVGISMVLVIFFFFLMGNILVIQEYKGENVIVYYCLINVGEGGWRDFELVYFVCFFFIGVMNIIVIMGFYVFIGLIIYWIFNKYYIS